MTDLRRAFEAFAVADAAAWPGLPDGLHVSDLARLAAFDPTDVRPDEAGDPPRAAGWIPLDTRLYAGGLRMWIDGERVVALEGIHPLDADGEFLPAPDLGPPQAVFETLLGPLWLPDGELVHAERGLAVRVNPDNGLLLGLVGFVPTTVDDYRARLRPVQEPARPLRRKGAIA